MKRTTASSCWSTMIERIRFIAWFLLRPHGRATRFPRKLSESGLFASVREGQPAPGVLPYEINSKLWSDGAIAERFLAIPGSGHDRRGWAGHLAVSRRLGAGADDLARARAGKPETRRRVETQILHRESEAWRPYSYLWNDEPGRRGTGRRRGSHPHDHGWQAGAAARANVPGCCAVGVRPVPQSLGREEDDDLRHPVGVAAGGEYCRSSTSG